jgi:fibronectin-binding autotransporter adhesin
VKSIARCIRYFSWSSAIGIGSILVLWQISPSSVHAVTIAEWTFETNVPAPATGPVFPQPPDSGNGFLLGLHASGSTSWSSPTGNGSLHSLAANNWTPGDSFLFHVSTTGMQNITIDWDQVCSINMPNFFTLEFSNDGTSFFSFGSPFSIPSTSLAGPWNSVVLNPAYHFSRDLSSVLAVNDSSDLFLRLAFQGPPPPTTQTFRIDNIKISGVPLLLQDVFWTAAGSGDWNSPSNWSAAVPNSASEKAIFGSAITSSAVVTVNEDITVGGIAFDNNAHSYTIAGDGVHSLTLAGPTTINVASGTHTISAPMTATGSVTKDGPGTLNLAGSLTAASFVHASGTFNHQTGALTINGSYSQPSGPLTVDGDSASDLPIFTLTNGGSTAGISGVAVGEYQKGELVVSDGSVVTNLGSGIFGSGVSAVIGRWAGAEGTALVSGPGSQWTNAGGMVVGSLGTGSLTISAGGHVTNSFLSFVGSDAGSIGSITVTGVGSQWSNDSSLYLGGRDSASGGTGTLTVSDGGNVNVAGALKLWNNGTVTLDGGSITAGSFDRTLGTFNHHVGTLTLTGGTYSQASGMLLMDGNSSTDPPSLVLSDGATTNGIAELRVADQLNASITVRSGSVLSNSIGQIGYMAGSEGAATVTGSNSQWNNSSNLFVGRFGAGTLTIESGGKVSNTNGFIALNSTGVGSVQVTGAGSEWNNNLAVLVGDGGTGTLLIESGGKVTSNVGSLALSGAIGYELDSQGTVTVTGAGSQWTNSSRLVVGVFGTGSLTIENGGQVSNTAGHVGSSSWGVGLVNVTGTGSVWTSSSGLEVGRVGTGTLTISNGGHVISNNDAVGGTVTGGSDAVGTVTVTGTGSQWTSGQLRLGDMGTGTLIIEESGKVSNTSLVIIGDDADSDGTATVSGAGSEWTIADSLTVGDDGVGMLTIENGGSVANVEGQIAEQSGSHGEVVVTGVGSSWTNTNSLSVGNRSAGKLTVSNGGSVASYFGFVGWGDGSQGEVVVTGPDSNWTNVGHLYLGFSEGATGKLTIENGGSLNITTDPFGTFGIIGYSSGTQGEVLVTGIGSTWTNSGSLSVGLGGVGTMVIENGGSVSNTFGFIGRETGSQGTVTVTGMGSTLILSDGHLIVGDEGTGEINITAGGTVASVQGVIARVSGSHGKVKVSGEGSTWTASGISSSFMSVGYEGVGELVIENGGDIQSVGGYIGHFDGGQGTATVTGAGSSWTSSANLTLGGFSGGPTTATGSLTVNDGGTVNVADTLRIHSGGTVHLQPAGSINTVHFNPDGGILNLSGGKLKTDDINTTSSTSKIVLSGNSSTIELTSDTSTFSGGVEGAGGFIKTGAGTLVLSNTNTYAGTTTVQNGTLDITGSHTTGTAYSVSAGAALITNNVRANSLTVDGSATVRSNGGTAGASKVETLALTGQLNLTNNDLVVGTGVVADVRAQIKLGLSGVSNTAAATGITSDLMTAAVHGFGYASGSDPNRNPLIGGPSPGGTLAGQTYDADSVLVKFTYRGDADLDGDSDLDDLGYWANSFTGDLGLGSLAAPTTLWTQGDWDYDGDTDLDDLGFWSSTFTGDLGGGGLSVYAPDAPASAIAALNQMGITAVPEPSAFALSLLAAITMIRSRRSRKL